MLAWQLTPQHEAELLSAYLTRVAHAHGQPPRTFYPYHLKAPHFWAQDIDRWLRPDRMRGLADLVGHPQERLRGMMLESIATALTPPSYSKRQPPAVVPWLNAVHSGQHSRRHAALQFCPDCLGELSSPRKDWRLGFAVTCEVHHRPMLTRCTHCGAPFLPFLAIRSARFCFRCGADLSRQAQRFWLPGWADSIPQVQRFIAGGLRMAIAGNDEGPRILATMRGLASIYPIWIKNSRLNHPPSVSDIHGYERFECETFEHRCRVLSWLAWLLEDWPLSFREMAEQLRITQRPFARMPSMCQWLCDEVERLPPGHTKDRFRTLDRLAHTLAELSPTKQENWRSLRASALAKALKLNEQGKKPQ